MKKEYICPLVKLGLVESETLLAGSGVSGGEIGYGGIDDEGSKEPAAKVSVWE